MRQISTEVATLLKLRSMIGANKPSYEVTVDTMPANSYQWDIANTWYKPSTTLAGDLTIAKKTNGKIICVLTQQGIFYEGECADINALTSQNDSVVNWTQINIINTGGYCAVSKVGNKLYLCVTDKGIKGTRNASTTLYVSDTGNGGDWVYYTTISSLDVSNIENFNGSYAENFNGAGCITVLKSGRWVIPCGIFTNYYNYLCQQYKILTSDDNGITWVARYTFSFYVLAHVYYEQGIPKHVIQVSTNLYLACAGFTGSGINLQLIKSVDNGITWNTILEENVNTWGGDTYWKDFEVISNNNEGLYLITNSDPNGYLRIYEIPNLNLPTEKIIIKDLTNLNIRPYTNQSVQEIDNKLLITKKNNVLGIDCINASLSVKSINISRNKNMAGSLNLSIDNKNGKWSPDGLTYRNVLFPNSKITVKQGYGINIIQTFVGLIDRIEMTTFPQELKLSIRDNLKLALDQTITFTDGLTHVVLFQVQTVEAIFTALCGYAGLPIGTIEATGLTITKTFSWETYADCFSFLADLCGFEYGADESGLIYFKKDTIVANPVASYVFKEGEDIISLGYTIDDNDLYSKIIVYGKDINDAVITATKDYVSKVYYKVLSQKIMKIDASDANTIGQCQAIADRAEMLMRSRVREVSFAAVAVPWLQVGDIIQVIESSTTISELYRVTDLSTTQDSSGYTMQITCYHHSA